MPFLILPLLGALIGWVTNRLALILLFRPYQPYLGLGILQGVIPKNREHLTTLISLEVERELLVRADLLSTMNTGENRARIAQAIASHLEGRFASWVPPFLPWRARFVRESRRLLHREIQRWLDQDFDELLGQFTQQIDVAQLVAARLDQLDLADIERLVRSMAGREFRAIELMGAALGALIGLVQMALVYVWW